MATKTLTEQINEARQRLDKIEQEKLKRSGQEYLVEPSYKKAYAEIESPELKSRISQTEAEMYAAPAELRSRYADVYDPREQERLVEYGTSQLQRKLDTLRAIKEKREATATDVGKFALAKYQAGTARLGAEYDVSKSAYDRLTKEEETEYTRGRESEADILAREKFAFEKYKEGVPTDLPEIGVKNAIGDKVGGTVSWRHNNPLNIKYGNFATKYGATSGQKATDGGQFAVFPDIDTGYKAARDLLTGPAYNRLPLEQALRKWSGNGYGTRQIFDVMNMTPIWTGKTTSQMSSKEINELIAAMQKMEGWKEGTIVTKGQETTFTDQEQKKLEQKFGTKWKTSASREQQLNYLYGSDQVEKIINSVYSKLLAADIPVELAKGILIDLQEGKSPSEVETALEERGWTKQYFKKLIDIITASPFVSAGITPVVRPEESSK